MIFIRGGRHVGFAALVAAVLLLNGTSLGQNPGAMRMTDLIASADRRMQALDYEGALPLLREILLRTETLTDEEGRKTAQTCRFELARILYQQGEIADGVALIEQYLNNEPRPQEHRALGMLAQGCFEVSNWDKIIELYQRLIGFRDLDPEVRFNMNLLAGQAYFQLGRYEDCIEPLRYAENNSRSERIEGVCQVMIVRALVELGSWEQLYSWVLRINHTDRRYDIALNLTLMQGAKRLYDEEEYLNSLYLYRMILPREVLLQFADRRMASLQSQLTGAATEVDERALQNELDEIKGAVKILKDLPPYEDEATFRIGQIYADVKRYWEGFAVFDKLCRQDPDSAIGEASALQAVMVLYAAGQHERAEARAIAYLDEKPGGQYARTLLSTMMRENLMQGKFDQAISLRSYIEEMRVPREDMDEQLMQADLHYMLAFTYLQSLRPREAGEQFAILLERYPESRHLASALYYRGMSSMLQADYANALADFKAFQEQYEENELFAESIFREGVCLYGLERVPESEAVFTRFINDYPAHPVVSEAYSLRGDIEAAKEASNEDPLTLDRAQADYRRAIDTAKLPSQASYPAFQAAKVYKMEFKWQEIIDLMHYYMDRWVEMADVAEAVYWLGQAQIQLGQLHDEAIPSYIDAIMRFGNDPQRSGVDKIISGLVTIADRNLSQDEREELIVRLKVKMSNTEEDRAVLRLRLQIAQALLEGEDTARAVAADLVDSLEDLSVTTPVTLSHMCAVAIDSKNYEQMKRLSDYFIENFPEAPSLWCAYKARALSRMEAEDYQGVLAAADEAQGLFGIDSNMGWAQLLKAKARYALRDFEEAENEYNMALNVPGWRGPIFAEAMYGMGECRLATSDFKGAHSFFQRTYLLFKAYDDGDWAAKGYIAAADCLMKLDRKDDAVKTLKAMLEDQYTKSNALAVKVREMLNTYGGE